MKLTLLVAYRNRPTHLRMLLEFTKNQPVRSWELLVIEAAAAPTLHQNFRLVPGCRFMFVEQHGVFSKATALNAGLRALNTEWVGQYDVDLLPVGDTLSLHMLMASQSDRLVVTGYRLLSDRSSIAAREIQEAIDCGRVAPEDEPSSIREYLVHGARFGVMPILQHDRLLRIGGWDESFRGWGAEDEDMLERYTSDGRYLVRSPHLVYIHQHHGPEAEWSEPAYVLDNRRRIYESRCKRGQPGKVLNNREVSTGPGD